MTAPTIGVIGGSGLYRLFDDDDDHDCEAVTIDTPYGPPSAPIRLGLLGDHRVAFLPRHGADHRFAPHLVPYRANIWALASLGVRSIVASSAVGGLSERAVPGAFVLPDQLIDRTVGRPDTFYDTGDVQHLAAAEPFDVDLHALALRALTDLGETVLPDGTTVVIQGPRFSTRAEAAWFRMAGADIVNMTQYPEAVLAAELNIALVALAFVTDTDAGTAAGDTSEAADAAVVLARMAEAGPRIRAAIAAIVAAVPHDFRGRRSIPPQAVDRVLGATSRVPVAGPVPARDRTPA